MLPKECDSKVPTKYTEQVGRTGGEEASVAWFSYVGFDEVDIQWKPTVDFAAH